MLKHTCLCGDEACHPESPGRLERILARLAETGILNRCDLVIALQLTILIVSGVN